MNMPALDIPDLLRRYGLRPDKKLGQNFLVDQEALSLVVAAAQLDDGTDVLEIGPGLGSLTRLLAARARRVVAVELDADLLPALQEVLLPFSNVQVIHGDILQLDPAQAMGFAEDSELGERPGYVVVANIPYYITSALLRHLLEARSRPKRLVLTLQEEVAKRICARPPDMSLLALSVQVFGKPRITAQIPARAFYPSPKVASAVIDVDLFPEPAVADELRPLFFRLVKAGFSQKRKMLRNALAGGMHWTVDQTEQILQSARIDPRRRAETLSLEEWQALASRVVGSTAQPEEYAG